MSDIQHSKVIILGSGPLTFLPTLEQPCVFLLPRDLSQFLNQKEGKYLALGQNPKQLTKLKSLLLNPKKENVGLAIQFLKGGGVPQSLLTPLYIAWKVSKDPKQKTELRKFLEQNMDDQTRRFISRPVRLNQPKQLKDWIKDTELDWEEIKAWNKKEK